MGIEHHLRKASSQRLSFGRTPLDWAHIARTPQLARTTPREFRPAIVHQQPTFARADSLIGRHRAHTGKRAATSVARRNSHTPRARGASDTVGCLARVHDRARDHRVRGAANREGLRRAGAELRRGGDG